MVLTLLKRFYNQYFSCNAPVKNLFGWAVPLSAPIASRIQLKIVIFASHVMMQPRVQQSANICVIHISVLLALVTVTTTLLYTVICIQFETLFDL